MCKSMSQLQAFDEVQQQWHVIIETPKGSHNKYKYEESLGLFTLSGVLPEGMSFPYDFGYLPATLGEDGDPLDVLLLMDHPAFCGCVVPSRLVGVIQAEQRERDGTVQRNDRLVAIPIKCRVYSDCQDLRQLNAHRLHEIQEFFVSYNRVHEKEFKVLGVQGSREAETLAQKGLKRLAHEQR
ncbi:MAG: inorganic diphosphatase [Bacillota bacterium]